MSAIFFCVCVKIFTLKFLVQNIRGIGGDEPGPNGYEKISQFSRT